MRRPDVYGMLQEIQWKTFEDWRIFTQLEPLDREVYQLAYIAQMLFNIHRDPKTHPDGLPIERFVLSFDSEEAKPEEPAQTVEYMETVLLAWMDGHNASLKEKGQWPESLT
ncbi:MAG TPA: hypothetical protein VM531_11065 [Sphingomicrobium sp.]|jgi:hypothetical protein|nr:hypothetical protein [Sphingomicrobium sp.]